MKSTADSSWTPLVAVVALWIPAMLAAAYGWRNGEYYDYGWFVPPAALFLAWRRWRDFTGETRPLKTPWVIAGVTLLLPWMLGLRVLGYADPSWRLPMGLLGMTAAVMSHLVIGATRGWKVSAGFLWITALLFSAIPWPVWVERGIVDFLTDHVVVTVAEVFQLLGKPVEVLGDRLQLHDLTVEVTDGCSGVRSFQSFIMATWFFAELQRLKPAKTGILLACAFVTGFVVNAARTYALAEIRFTRGEEAFHRAHDSLGLLAFAVSGILFYLISGKLSESAPRKLVRRVQTR